MFTRFQQHHESFVDESWMTYWNAVGVLLANALSFGLALLEGVLVLEL